MINLDTNVLLRCFVDDDAFQARQARQLLAQVESDDLLYISSYALMELGWMLRTYKIPRETIIGHLQFLLDAPKIIIGNRRAVAAALECFAKGRADFADYLILAEGQAAGSAVAASFDKALVGEQSGVRHPKALLAHKG